MKALIEIIRENTKDIARGDFLRGWSRVIRLPPDAVPEGTSKEKTQLGDVLVEEFPGRYTTKSVGCVAYLIGLEVSTQSCGELQDFAKNYFAHYFASYSLKMIREREIQDSDLKVRLEDAQLRAEGSLKPYWQNSQLLGEFVMSVLKAVDKWRKIKIEGLQAIEELMDEVNAALRSGQRSKAQEAAKKLEALKAEAPERVMAGSIFADCYDGVFFNVKASSKTTPILSTGGHEKGLYLGFFDLLSRRTGYDSFCPEGMALIKMSIKKPVN